MMEISVIYIYIYIYIYISLSYKFQGLGGLVVIHSAAKATSPGFNSVDARAYLRFNSHASTLAGKQCWLYAVRLHQTVIV